VLFALLPHSLVLDWAGPAEALRIANQVLRAQGLPPRFELRFVSPCPDTDSSVGVRLAGLEPLPDTLKAPAWVVLVGLPGEVIEVGSDSARALLHWLRGLRLATGALELVTVCAGAVLAAHAGLLAAAGPRHTTTICWNCKPQPPHARWWPTACLWKTHRSTAAQASRQVLT
jgi:transcriptional regulator GlxA family with amidase domain